MRTHMHSYTAAGQREGTPLSWARMRGAVSRGLILPAESSHAFVNRTYGRYGTVEFSAGVVQLARVLAQEPRISVEAWHKERWARGSGEGGTVRILRDPDKGRHAVPGIHHMCIHSA